MTGGPLTHKKVVVHNDPVWRGRANFIINGELGDAGISQGFEQLWARQLGEDRFEICCIPFFLFDVALGDVVVTAARSGREYVVDRVVEASGRFVFRVWFGESFHPRDEIAEQLTQLGALLEWSSVNLLAVDVADSVKAQEVADFLQNRYERGELLYETGRSA